MKSSMKNICATMGAAIIALSSCQQSEMEDVTLPETDKKPLTITVTIEKPVQTRIDFGEDTKTGGVKVDWAAGDAILMYNSTGGYQSNADIKEPSTGVFDIGMSNPGKGTHTLTFKSPNYEAILGSSWYTLSLDEYRAALKTYAPTQDGSGTFNHLNDVIHIEGTLIIDDSNEFATTCDVTMTHQQAMLTLKIAPPADYNADTDGVPSKLTVVNGTDTYTLNLSNITWADSFTAHLLVYPASGTRDMKFTVETANGTKFNKTISSSNDYSAGSRYTGELKDSNVLVKEVTYALGTLSATNVPAEDTWIISDASANDASAFDGLKAALDKARSVGRNISLKFPNLTSIPEESFSSYNNLIDIDLPEVTSIGKNAFRSSSHLAKINLPKAETIGEGAFFFSTLTKLDLPEATFIDKNAFSSCYFLTEINLPKVETIGESAIYANLELIEIYLPSAKSIGASAFDYCQNIATISLPKIESIGDMSFANCDQLVTLYLGTDNPNALTSVGRFIFNGTTETGNITLTLGAAEYDATVNGTTWTTSYRGFKEIKRAAPIAD